MRGMEVARFGHMQKQRREEDEELVDTKQSRPISTSKTNGAPRAYSFANICVVYPRLCNTVPAASSLSVLGPHKILYIEGKPQTKTSVSSEGGNAYFLIFISSIQPVSAVYVGVVTQLGGAGSSGLLPTTCTIRSLSPAVLAHVSSCSFIRISSGVLFP